MGGGGWGVTLLQTSTVPVLYIPFTQTGTANIYSCCILFGMVTLQGENIAGKNRDIVKHQVTLRTINFYPIRGQGVGYIYIFIILN